MPLPQTDTQMAYLVIVLTSEVTVWACAFTRVRLDANISDKRKSLGLGQLL